MKADAKILLMVFLVLVAMIAVLIIDIENKSLIDERKDELLYLQTLEIRQLKARFQDFKENQYKIMSKQEQIIDTQVRILEMLENMFSLDMEVTGYAPLDPSAVEGMCFSGDPSITASGHPSIPNWSIAAGHRYPFGTLMWIEGIGLRQVHDRGGMISDNHIDVMTKTRQQSFAIGRGTRRVVVIREGE
ncbi:MAG: 3D domain-containing protein [Clostridiales bacterium]|nr:3D domain-containing protein [Clostridiales bacterium]